MAKRKSSNGELEEIGEQMRILRKKLRKLSRADEVRKSHVPTGTAEVQIHDENKENGE